VTSVGSVVCFGDDTSGQIGGGTSSPSPVLMAAAPVFALGATPDLVRGSVGAAARHTCAVSRDGRVYCWGSNSDGQLGDPTLASGFGAVGAPREVTGLR
jgi:alpha-tubulin suppressor-like RCC1 family protein